MNKMENKMFYFDGGRDRIILPPQFNEDIENERIMQNKKLGICPVYGTGFCDENCPSNYEECDRLKELIGNYK